MSELISYKSTLHALRTISGEEIGVSQILNKIDGEFEQEDLDLLEAMTEQEHSNSEI